MTTKKFYAILAMAAAYGIQIRTVGELARFQHQLEHIITKEGYDKVAM